MLWLPDCLEQHAAQEHPLTGHCNSLERYYFSRNPFSGPGPNGPSRYFCSYQDYFAPGLQLTPAPSTPVHPSLSAQQHGGGLSPNDPLPSDLPQPAKCQQGVISMPELDADTEGEGCHGAARTLTQRDQGGTAGTSRPWLVQHLKRRQQDDGVAKKQTDKTPPTKKNPAAGEGRGVPAACRGVRRQSQPCTAAVSPGGGTARMEMLRGAPPGWDPRGERRDSLGQFQEKKKRRLASPFSEIHCAKSFHQRKKKKKKSTKPTFYLERRKK